MRHYQLLIEIDHWRGLLLENRMDFLKQKYVPLIAAMIQKLVQEKRPLPPPLIPTAPTVVQGKFDEIAGKFIDMITEADPDVHKKNTQWLLNLFVKDQLKVEDLYKATEYLTLYQRVKAQMPVEQRDLNKYQSLDMLFATIEPYQKEKSAREADREFDAEMHKQAEVVFNDTDYKITIPKTREASCYFGKNTQWCTAATNSWNAFDHYNQDGALYIILDKKNNRRWQYHPGTGQFMDERDRSVNKQQFAQEHPKVAQAFAALDGEPVATILRDDVAMPVYRTPAGYEVKTYPGFGDSALTITVRDGICQKINERRGSFDERRIRDLLNQLKVKGDPNGQSVFSHDLFYRNGQWGSIGDVGKAVLHFQDGHDWCQVQYKTNEKSQEPPHKPSINRLLVLVAPANERYGPERESLCHASIEAGVFSIYVWPDKTEYIGHYVVDLLLQTKGIKEWAKDSKLEPNELDAQDAKRLIAGKPYLADLGALYKVQGATSATRKLIMREFNHHDMRHFGWISDDTLAVRKWDNIHDCVIEIGNDTARYYSKLDNGDEDLEIYDAAPSEYAIDDLLAGLPPDELAALGKWLAAEDDAADVIENEMDGDYDPTDARDVRRLYVYLDNDDLKSAFARAYSSGLEAGGRNEATKLLARAIESNNHIFFLNDGKWNTHFVYDVPVALGVSIAEIIHNLPDFDSYLSWEDAVDAKIDVTEPHYGLSDYDEEAAKEVFSEDLHELLP